MRSRPSPRSQRRWRRHWQTALPASPIEPDRPDVTNGTHLVDVGLLQLEAGVQHARMGSQHSSGTPLTARIGLFEWLEARASTDGFLHQADSASTASGIGNVQIGAKLRLFADPGGVPVLSILPTVNLPLASASKGLGSGDSDITVVLLTGTDLNRTSHVDFNYGIGAIGAGQGRPHFSQHLVSVSLSHTVTEQLTLTSKASGSPGRIRMEAQSSPSTLHDPVRLTKHDWPSMVVSLGTDKRGARHLGVGRYIDHRGRCAGRSR